MNLPPKPEEAQIKIAKKSLYLSYDQLKKMESFKYRAEDKSILYKFIVSPFLDVVVEYVPTYIAPNLITICSFFLNTATFALIMAVRGNNFSDPPNRWICLIYSLCHLLYIIFDNLDGKQARRTKTSSCLGMILDHGIDAITCTYISINMCHITSLGNYLIGFSIFWANCLGFWTVMYEELLCHYLSLGYINGANEGVMLVFIATLFSTVFTPEFWHYEVFWIFDVIYLTIFLLAIGSLYTIGLSLTNIYRLKGVSCVVQYFLDSFLIFMTMLFPVFNYLFMLSEFYKYMDLIFYQSALMFIRMTIQILIDIASDSEFRQKRFYVIILSYVLIMGILSASYFENNFIEENEDIIKYVFYGTIGVNLLELIVFIIDMCRIIPEFLGIGFLSIKTEKQEPLIYETKEG